MDSPCEQGKFNLYEVVNEHNEPIIVFGEVASMEEVSTVLKLSSMHLHVLNLKIDPVTQLLHHHKIIHLKNRHLCLITIQFHPMMCIISTKILNRRPFQMALPHLQMIIMIPKMTKLTICWNLMMTTMKYHR